jgi:acetyl-CoA C-acetyltransferase
MYAAPYTRWHCSQWNVDQASAFVICSAEAADRFGVGRETWVFPLAAVESNAMVPLSQRGELHRAPAVSAGVEQLTAMSGVDPRDADLDLVCAPPAVRVQAESWPRVRSTAHRHRRHDVRGRPARQLQLPGARQDGRGVA